MSRPASWSGKIIFTSDWQYPFIDWRAEKLGRKVARELRPDLLIFGGDILDLDGFSRRFQHTLPGDRRVGKQAQAECREAGELMAKWRKETRAKEALFLGGNHEARLEQFVREVAPMLDGTVAIEEWTELKRHGIGWVPYVNGNGRLHVGHPFKGMTFLHGFAYKGGKMKNAGAAALGHVGKIDGSVCHGHTNRCISVMERRPDRYVYGVEAGCLCCPEAMAAQYNPIPDLQQGLAFIVLKNGIVEHADVIRLDVDAAWVPTRRIS